jgi:competence protein ComEA
MVMKKIALAMAAVVFAGGVAFAQPKTTPPAATSTPAPGASSKPAKPASTSGTLPAGTKINLNTATAAELDSLPQIGAARTKLIMSERAKGNFKDWADFDSRMSKTSVNKGVRAKIKDHVTF